VLAVVIAFAPAALVFCEASCAEHAPAAVPVDHAAHHHHESPGPDATTVAMTYHAHRASLLAQVTSDLEATAHRCTHGDALPVAAGVSVPPLFAPAIVSAAFVLPDVPTIAVSLQDIAFRAPPHPSALTTQLRL
jgi:hypothetical protein